MSRCTRPSIRPPERNGARNATESRLLTGERNAPLVAPTAERRASAANWRPRASGELAGCAGGARTSWRAAALVLHMAETGTNAVLWIAASAVAAFAISVRLG